MNSLWAQINYDLAKGAIRNSISYLKETKREVKNDQPHISDFISQQIKHLIKIKNTLK